MSNAAACSFATHVWTQKSPRLRRNVSRHSRRAIAFRLRAKGRTRQLAASRIARRSRVASSPKAIPCGRATRRTSRPSPSACRRSRPPHRTVRKPQALQANQSLTTQAGQAPTSYMRPPASRSTPWSVAVGRRPVASNCASRGEARNFTLRCPAPRTEAPRRAYCRRLIWCSQRARCSPTSPLVIYELLRCTLEGGAVPMGQQGLPLAGATRARRARESAAGLLRRARAAHRSIKGEASILENTYRCAIPRRIFD